ncbi:MAG: hypothetical protein R3323_02090 [Wenzhouxiangellaceae bacterium]|nr:hypothetical protein [Wenzhouxiangellaceae bacterium]
MILRRLGRSIREQDWFAVSLELAVVVVGIFLGLQVTDWNETRKARAGERLYLERLHAELGVATGELAQRFDNLTERMEQSSAALVALNAGDLGDLAAQEFGYALMVVQRNETIDSGITTIEELISTGNLARIRDPGLRARIAGSYLSNESLRRYIEMIAERMAGVLPVLHTRYQPRIRGTPFEEVRFDFDALASDAAFINAYAAALMYLGTNRWWVATAHDDLEALRAEVGEALGRETVAPVRLLDDSP